MQSPDCQRCAPLSGEAKYPAGARPSKCIIITARESYTEKEFTDAANSTCITLEKVRIKPPGLTTWEIRPGFLCSVLETRKMDITLHDTDGNKHKITMEGDRPIEKVQAHLRQRWKLPPWVKIVMPRQGGKPFFIEDKADYTVAMQYDPDLDPRPLVTIRIDASDRSHRLDNIRVDEGPAALIDSLGSKLGFQFPKVTSANSPRSLHG
jgi:hypothetical protein